jgi:integrase
MSELTRATIAALPAPAAGNKVHFFSGAVVPRQSKREPELVVPRGFGVRVTKDGSRAFVLNYWLGGKQRSYTIGRHPDWSVLEAVKEARELRVRVDRGDDPLAEKKAARAPEPVPEPAKTVADVIDAFLVSHVDKQLRRPDNYRAAFARIVKPAIGSVPLNELQRSHIVAMANGISADVMADRTLAYLSSALNWYAGQDDAFNPPKLKGLRRVKGRSRDRDRVLNDDELRVVWRASEVGGTFGAVVRLLLLTGQRRSDVYGMAWEEIDDSGVWTIPKERYKTGEAHTVPLSKAALAIVEGQPCIGRLVFPSTIGGRLGKGGNRKEGLDKAITKARDGVPLAHWTQHDLRRTARTLMARAGVRPDVAERVVGHVVGNSVARIYDRFEYDGPKREALEALARQIGEILEPQATTPAWPKRSAAMTELMRASLRVTEEYLQKARER